MSKTQPATMAKLQDLLAKVTKSAESYTEPGSIGGSTSHPSGKTEDQTEAAQTGSRASEYTSDIKKDQGEMGVEAAGDPPGSQEAQQEKIGPVSSKSTGTDPANETSSVKGTKEDPGTSHPATTEDGEKYGSAAEKLAALVKAIDADGRQILAHFAKQSGATEAAPAAPAAKQAAEKPAASPASAAPDEETLKAAQAGYDLANLLADVDMPVEDKRACDESVYGQVRQIVSVADYAATKVAMMLAGQKQAEESESGESRAEEAHESPAEESQEHEGHPAPGGAPAMGDDAMPSEEELLAMLAGGEGGGMGGEMGGGGGGDELGQLQALLGGGGGGGEMGGGAPGMPGDGGGDDAAILQQILQELNVSPEQATAKVAAAIRKRQKSSGDNLARRKQAMARLLRDVLRA